MKHRSAVLVHSLLILALSGTLTAWGQGQKEPHHPWVEAAGIDDGSGSRVKVDIPTSSGLWNGMEMYDMVYDPVKKVTHVVFVYMASVDIDCEPDPNNPVTKQAYLRHTMHDPSYDWHDGNLATPGNQHWSDPVDIPIGMLDIGDDYMSCYVGSKLEPLKSFPSSCVGGGDIYWRYAITDPKINNNCNNCRAWSGEAHPRGVSIAVDSNGDLGVLYSLAWLMIPSGVDQEVHEKGDIRFVRGTYTPAGGGNPPKTDFFSGSVPNLSPSIGVANVTSESIGGGVSFRRFLTLDLKFDSSDIPEFVVVGGDRETTINGTFPTGEPLKNGYVAYVKAMDADFCGANQEQLHQFSGEWEFRSIGVSHWDSSAMAEDVEFVTDANNVLHVVYSQFSTDDPVSGLTTPGLVYIMYDPASGVKSFEVIDASLDPDDRIQRSLPTAVDLKLNTTGDSSEPLLHCAYEKVEVLTGGSRLRVHYATSDGFSNPWSASLVTPNNGDQIFYLGGLLVVDINELPSPPPPMDPDRKVRIVTGVSNVGQLTSETRQYLRTSPPPNPTWSWELGHNQASALIMADVNPVDGQPVVVDPNHPKLLWTNGTNLYIQVQDQTDIVQKAPPINNDCYNKTTAHHLENAVDVNVLPTGYTDDEFVGLTVTHPPIGGIPKLYGFTHPSGATAAENADITPLYTAEFTNGLVSGTVITSVLNFWQISAVYDSTPGTLMPIPWGGSLKITGELFRSGRTKNVIVSEMEVGHADYPPNQAWFQNRRAALSGTTEYQHPPNWGDPLLNCSRNKNTSCGAAPLYSGAPLFDSFGNALLPLIPAMLALFGWVAFRRREV